MTKQKLIAITGPSSSGKTKLAIETAKVLNGEIISVDSRQIYKELNIGSAKPSMREREGIVHHLIDITDITQDFTAADYCDIAQKTVNEILSRGKTVILAGGTGLYFRILLQDFDLPRVAPDNELRNKLNEKSSQELYSMLTELDCEIAKKIHYNNKVKIIRALEVCIKLGIPMSAAQKKKETPYEVKWFGLDSNSREFLYSRINERTDLMIKNGLIDEAESLFNKYGQNKILMSTIGYQEFFPYFMNQQPLDEAVENLKQNTRRYAKRQISWFKQNKEILRLDIENLSVNQMLNTIINSWSE
ncbi:MAG: tRNA (adenosine(37)-N6)-dimethylallyltransferase MiaA [Candidatus Gastranaerophilales bacterium]|nr:tRNA (adenosine(37)-N6)-dimethylallyltransferase MiaA [Candidatus Gastranaerophilales bacterium]